MKEDGRGGLEAVRIESRAQSEARGSVRNAEAILKKAKQKKDANVYV